MRNKHTVPEIPTLEQIEAARERLQYNSKYRKTLRSTIGVLIVVAAIAILVATLWMPVLQIYGSSMFPTLKDGQIVACVKGSHFETGELVAFYYGNKLLIKRVIGSPGDWINIDEEGSVSVNGELLDEPYVTEKALGECSIKFPYQVPDERWFVMGDNRAVSVDSRSSQVGCVAQEQIVGKIVFRVWPVREVGQIN